MTVTDSPERTGQFLAIWRVGGDLEVDAPPKATMRVDVIEDLPREPGRQDIVIAPGDVRYLLGVMHPDRPFHRYVHRLNP